MLKSEFNKFLVQTLEDIIKTSQSGQKEYALNEDAFDNFNRLSQNLNIDRKSVLFIYMQKHLDGIVAYINGHKSQREDVRGRIKDVIVYSLLLWGMVNEEDNLIPNKTAIGVNNHGDPNIMPEQPKIFK